MKSVKVLIISLIIFSLSINISPIVFADIPDEKVQNSEMATMVLKYLNIISESEGITFDATKGVKREELARFLWKLNDDNQELLPCETNFKDVDSTNANSGYISAMNKAKVMLGDTDGLFYPEQLITYNEAIITLVRLCGYEPMVDIKSGSDGYYKVATSIDLLKGIANTSKTDVISCGTLLTLMYNSLDIPLMMIEKYGENPTYIKDENKTILTEVFGLYFEEGVVSATCDTALTHEKSGLQKSQVEISGKVYATSGSSVETYLGHKIKFLYKNLDGSHEREVVLVLKDFSRVTQINADDIIEFSDYTYLVHDENNKNSVKYKIQANCDILYNGRAIESVIDTPVFVPKTGDVKLVDNNNDGKYDVIFVSEYTAMIVDNVNIKEMTIYDKHDSERNIKIDIPFENVMVKDENGKMIKLEDIQKNNVVFVGWSLEKTTLELLVSKQKVTGFISNIKKAGERKYITVDNKEYPLSKNMDKNKIENLKLGESGKFYLDKNGAIFDGEKMDKQEYQIGYLLNATISNDLNEKMELKILTLSNDIKIFDVDDRILIDGVKYSKKKKLAYDSLLDGGRIRRTPIYYTINAENKVTMLDTPYIKNPKDNELKDSIHQYMDTNGNVVFKYGLKSLDAKILLDTQTIVFIEPANADDEEAYFVTNLYYFKNDLSYNGRAYTDVENFDYAKIVSIRGTASSIDWGSGLHLISDICTSLNEEGDSVLKVQTYIGQTKNEYCFKDESVLKGKELEVGDLIILHADSKGKIDNMEFIYDESENKYYTDKAFDPEGFGARHRLIFAPVIEKVGDIVKFSTDGNGKNPDNSNLELYDASKFPIVVFNRKTKKVEEVKGSGEIVTTKNDPENASMVSVYMTWANPISMYIYND